MQTTADVLLPPARQLTAHGGQHKDDGQDGEAKEEKKFQAHSSQHLEISLKAEGKGTVGPRLPFCPGLLILLEKAKLLGYPGPAPEFAKHA
jgi:hypothetical protein